MNAWLTIGSCSSAKASRTSNPPWTGSVGPPWPARSPLLNSWSTWKSSASLRYSPPKLKPMPRSDHGVWMPYSPPSIVTLALAIDSFELGGRQILEAPAVELRRPLHRNQALAVVAVDATQVWITPRRAGDGLSRGRGDPGKHRQSEAHDPGCAHCDLGSPEAGRSLAGTQTISVCGGSINT